MRQSPYIIVVLLSFFTNLLVGQRYYCYTPDGRRELKISTTRLTIRPMEDVPLSEVQGILNSSGLFRHPLAKDDLGDFKNEVFLKVNEVASSDELETLIKDLEALPEIKSVYPFVETESGQLMTYDDVIYVGLKSSGDRPTLARAARQFGLHIEKRNEYDPLQYRIKVSEQQDALQIANQLAESRLFEYAEVDFIQFVSLSGTGNEHKSKNNDENTLLITDPLYPMQWHLENTGMYPSGSNVYTTADADIDASAAWVTTAGNPNIKIAIVDDGVDTGDLDLVPNLLPGYDATGTGETAIMSSATGHGTEVAEVAASANNGMGGVGVAYQCSVVPVKIFENIPGFGGGTVTRNAWVADGIDWAWKKGHADVLNNSYGSSQSSALVTAAIQRATSDGRNGMGSLCFFATGNENFANISYPSSLAEVIAVGATNSCDYRRAPTSAPSCDGDVSWGSNYGTGLDVVAPGNYIESTSGNSSGTSFACPIATGIGALILSVNPSLTATQVRYYLESTCEKVSGYTFTSGVSGQPNGSWNNEVGYGRVNANLALNAVLAPYMYDVAVESITPPVSNCGLGAAETISVKLINYGSVSATSIQVRYRIKLNGGAFGSWTNAGTYNGLIDFLDNDNFSFNINVSMEGHYTLEVESQYVGDSNYQNDIASTEFDHYKSVNSFPYDEDFETDNGGWYTAGANNPFIYGSPYTGNSFINTVGSGSYCWWTNDPGSTAGYFPFQTETHLYSPCLDFSGFMQDPIISFKLIYQLDVSNVTDNLVLEASTDSGATWSIVGGQGSGTNWYNSLEGWTGISSPTPGQWLDVRQSLTGLAGESDVRLRFNFSSDTGTENEGVGIDMISIKEPPTYDASVAAITKPVSDCDLGVTEQVEVIIENKGANIITSCPVYYRYDLDGMGFTSWNLVGNYNGSINPGGSDFYSFQADFSAQGSYQLEVKTQLSGDADNTNDAKATAFSHYAPIVNYPYTESFEVSDGFWMSGGTSSSWQLGAPSAHTILSASDGTKAWETNLNGTPNEDENSYVRSPCFDFSGLTSPQINMDVWWDCSKDNDGARLEYSTDGGNTWATLGSYNEPDNWYNSQYNDGFGGEPAWSGYDVYGGLNNWVTAKHELAGLAGQSNVLFRIVFAQDPVSSVTPNLDGFAFDNITIAENNLVDVGISEIILPVTYGCSFTTSEHVKVRVKNFGNTPQFDIPIQYRINNPSGSWVLNGYFTDTLAAGATGTYTFSENFSNYGEYLVEVRTALPADGNSSNDTATKTVEHLHSVSSFPWCTDFEQPGSDWIIRGQSPSWAEGVPAGTKIDTAAGGTKVIMTGLNSGYSTNEESYIISPCLDLSAMNFGIISFDLWYETEAGKDGLQLQYSINGGETWVPENIQTNPYNNMNITSLAPSGNSEGWSGSSGGWVRAQAYISPLGTSEVIYRFVFASDASGTDDGVAIDNICLVDLDTNNPSSSALGACADFNLYGVKGYDSYLVLDSNGNSVGGINPNGNNLGNITFSYNKMLSVPQGGGGVYYLPRYFNIECSGGADCPASGTFPQGNVSVDLYFEGQELTDYNMATGLSYTAADLYATHFDGANENCDLDDNGSGTYTLIDKVNITDNPITGGNHFYLSMALPSFSELGLHGTSAVLSPGSALPLELQSFTARLLPPKREVLVEWITSNELNMAAFEVERSTEGVNFEKIATIPAKRTYSNSYQITDKNPASGLNYYRLKMLNRDGTFEYSSIKSVKTDGASSGIRLWPQPVRDVVHIEAIGNNPFDDLKVKIIGLDGRLMKQTDWKTDSEKSVFDWNINTLPTGVYLLKIQRGNGAVSFLKLIKS